MRRDQLYILQNLNNVLLLLKFRSPTQGKRVTNVKKNQNLGKAKIRWIETSIDCSQQRQTSPVHQ